ncbi:uncharacterized protein LOC112458422 [Temnothorax curvispinosus]|uniref:Uncharacterized protein LOC112458422 n=1 Tax=Temnothorax curvispinosus TaxID=300111 RepID=A0A6J1Q809_9HYME|nr:uncharacterized protein LOC112458422 [Temnothorax curvispinosus]
MDSQLWWNGPLWLQYDKITTHPLTTLEDNEEPLGEDGEDSVIVMPLQTENDIFGKFSTLNKLIRVTATCIRFALICRKEVERGILRVGGRLQNSKLQEGAKHPVLLPHRSRFTELVIEHEHRKMLHAGANSTLAAVRLEYWPLKARGTIKRLVRGCITCFKSKPQIPEQIMGNLPAHRVTPSRPFENTGVDFCGPIYVREGRGKGRKNIKAYVAVFVCMATKAVHLEVVSDLTTEAFLNAFKRFIGRRGRPSDVFSDNGTNFVGANRELEELRDLLNREEEQKKLIDYTATEKIKWHFIPSRAPHFGDLWEATVKSFKNHFYKVASDAAMTFEEASTLVIQIEAILNSRPIAALSSDPNDLSYLTAGHFIIGRRSKWYKNNDAQFQIGQLILCKEDGLPPLKWVLGRIQKVCPGSDGIAEQP